jgi:YVTN family beta-propeller protein
LALDDHDGRVYVANVGSCTVSVIDGRARSPHVVATIPIGQTPQGVVVDPAGGRVFVAESGDSSVRVVDRVGASYRIGSAVGLGTAPGALAVLPIGRDMVVAICAGFPDPNGGTLHAIDFGFQPPRVAPPLHVQGTPLGGLAHDPVSGITFVVDNRYDQIWSVRAKADGSMSLLGAVPVDTGDLRAKNFELNPVADVFLPRTRQLVVTT